VVLGGNQSVGGGTLPWHVQVDNNSLIVFHDAELESRGVMVVWKPMNQSTIRKKKKKRKRLVLRRFSPMCSAHDPNPAPLNARSQQPDGQGEQREDKSRAAAAMAGGRGRRRKWIDGEREAALC